MPHNLPFELAVITDEIAADLETALPVARELGLSLVELNSVGGKNVADLSPAERERARERIEGEGFGVVVVGPPCFKTCVLDSVPSAARVGEDAVFREHMATLERAALAAQAFGAGAEGPLPMVRVFSFRRSDMPGLGNPSPRLPGAARSQSRCWSGSPRASRSPAASPRRRA